SLESRLPTGRRQPRRPGQGPKLRAGGQTAPHVEHQGPATNPHVKGAPMDPIHTTVASTDNGTQRVRPAYAGALDDLLRFGADDLATLYATARTPRVGDVSGRLRGRLLAVVGMPRVLSGAARALAGSDRFPWRGKSFTPHGEHEGEGTNRIFTDRIE